MGQHAALAKEIDFSGGAAAADHVEALLRPHAILYRPKTAMVGVIEGGHSGENPEFQLSHSERDTACDGRITPQASVQNLKR